MAAKARVLLWEHPDHRDYIIEELRWKGCRATGYRPGTVADKTPDPTANLTGCFDCHKPQASNDYVFSFDKLKLAAR